MKFSAWISAFRLRTLPLALSTIGMGTFLALEQGVFNFSVFFWATITTVFLQVLSNLANDYGDSVNGADSVHRIGPERAVQSGVISIAEMRVGIIVFAVLSLFSGIALLYVAVGIQSADFYLFLGLGLLSILAAYTYTAGKRPYGYAGFGDIMVLIFFGVLGVGGSFYLYSRELDFTMLLPSLALGLLATGVLNINNIRDEQSDKLAGKQTIPVRFGHKAAIKYHWALLVLSVLLSAIYIALHEFNYTYLLWLVGLPLIIYNGIQISRIKEGKLLDPYLKQLAIATFVYMIFFGLALII
jgi:1,4-dihydroxy-2-naphthoate octaprenyltransferase